MLGSQAVESSGLFVALVTPLIAVPLTAITFYLRSLREQQQSGFAGLVQRIETVERSVLELRGITSEFNRDYTTKEEWLRECMLARQTLEQLRAATVRLEAVAAMATSGRAMGTASRSWGVQTSDRSGIGGSDTGG